MTPEQYLEGLKKLYENLDRPSAFATPEVMREYLAEKDRLRAKYVSEGGNAADLNDARAPAHYHPTAYRGAPYRGAPAADDPQPTVDATQLPPAPSSLAELSEWIRSARELLRDQEDQPIDVTGIAYLVREHFLQHLERLCPDWTEWYRQCRPDEFRVVRELVVMMTEVGQRIGGEDVAGSKRIGFGRGNGVKH
jgi:hypothetical protein